MLLRVVLVVVLASAVLGDALYVVRVGNPWRYPDRLIGWFMASIGIAAIGSHAVLGLFVAGALRGELAGWVYVAAGVVEVAAIWFRTWMSWRAVPKLKDEEAVSAVQD